MHFHPILSLSIYAQNPNNSPSHPIYYIHKPLKKKSSQHKPYTSYLSHHLNGFTIFVLPNDSYLIH